MLPPLRPRVTSMDGPAGPSLCHFKRGGPKDNDKAAAACPMGRRGGDERETGWREGEGRKDWIESSEGRQTGWRAGEDTDWMGGGEERYTDRERGEKETGEGGRG